MQTLVKLLGCVSLLSLGACATIAGDDTKSVSINATPSAANCAYSNSRDSGQVVPPGNVIVPRSISPLHVVCVDPGTNSMGDVSIESEFDKHDSLNIFTLGLGMLVDWTSGSAYTYPDTINVPLTLPINEAQPMLIAPVVPAIVTEVLPAPVAVPAPVLVPVLPPQPLVTGILPPPPIPTR